MATIDASGTLVVDPQCRLLESRREPSVGRPLDRTTSAFRPLWIAPARLDIVRSNFPSIFSNWSRAFWLPCDPSPHFCCVSRPPCHGRRFRFSSRFPRPRLASFITGRNSAWSTRHRRRRRESVQRVLVTRPARRIQLRSTGRVVSRLMRLLVTAVLSPPVASPSITDDFLAEFVLDPGDPVVNGSSLDTEPRGDTDLHHAVLVRDRGRHLLAAFLLHLGSTCCRSSPVDDSGWFSVTLLDNRVKSSNAISDYAPRRNRRTCQVSDPENGVRSTVRRRRRRSVPG